MDTLKGIPEHVEADFGDSIVARDEAVAALGRNPGLGPPDLCWLQKCQKRTLLGGSSEAQGYYHYVLGRDVSSSAAVAAYFALLNSKVEPLTMLQGLWMKAEFTIQRGFYCCYDPLSRMDLRCELCVPGGVVVGCVDAAGTLHDVTPQLWMQVQVSSFVRAMLYDPEMRLNGGSVITYNPVPTAAAERSLLQAVYTLYSNGSLPGALQDIYAEQGCGVLPEHMDVVLAALWQHFRQRQRWHAADAFFRQLAQVYSPAALLVAATARAEGIGSTRAIGYLLSDLLLHSDHDHDQLPPASLVGLGAELLQSGQPAQAADLARQALQLNHRCRPAWLLLAQCFIAQRQYAAALVALNVVPTPPLPAAEVELLHVVPPPQPKNTTQPMVGLYDGELASVKWCALEEASLDGSRLLAYLPGAILINKEPLGQAHTPDTSPNRVTRSVLAAVYNLLQDIVAETSWDAFLDVRSRVFLMQQEATPRASTDTGIQQQQQLRQSMDMQQRQWQQSQDQLSSMSAADHQHQHPHVMTAVQQQLQQLTVQQSESALQLQQPHSGPSADSTAAAAAVSSGGSRVPGVPLRGCTPPSRGQLSSGSGGHKGSPKSYYANKLHDELGKSSAAAFIRPGSASDSVSADKAQQQQQQQKADSAPSSTQQAAAAAAAASRVSDPSEQQRSMAGRVLLLGRKHSRRITKPYEAVAAAGSSRSSKFGSSGAALGCGVPRNLSPNEVVDLSRYASASRIAPLRTIKPGASITPELADVVFGAAAESAADTAAGAADNAAKQQVQQHHHVGNHHHQQQQQQADDDAVSKTAAMLPRIKTRPVAEGVEESRLDQVVSPEHMYQQQSSSSRQHHRSWLHICLGRQQQPACRMLNKQQQQPQAHDGRRISSSSSSSAGPLGEGLDRTASLLVRTSSTTSSHMGPTASPVAGRPVNLSSSSTTHTLSHQPSSGGFVLSGGGSSAFGASLARKASITGEAISRTLEADREGLMSGHLCDDESVGLCGAGGDQGAAAAVVGAVGRRLCVRWLDELIVSLWHDLQAYMEWKVWDQALKEHRGGTHADLVLGLVAQPSTPNSPVSDGGNVTPPSLTATDWMRRGALAERLGHVSDARAAYRAAVKLQFNLTSYLALLRLEAQAGNVSDALLCAAQVLAWHQQRLSQSGSSGSGSDQVVMGAPPEVVGWALGLVADSSSAQEVKQAAATVGTPASVVAAVEEWIKWQQVQAPNLLNRSRTGSLVES